MKSADEQLNPVVFRAMTVTSIEENWVTDSNKCSAISAHENSRADSLLCFFSRKENLKSQLQDSGKSYCYGTLWDRLKRKGGESTVTGLWLHATDHNLLTHLAVPLKEKKKKRAVLDVSNFRSFLTRVMGAYEDCESSQVGKPADIDPSRSSPFSLNIHIYTDAFKVWAVEVWATSWWQPERVCVDHAGQFSLNIHWLNESF